MQESKYLLYKGDFSYLNKLNVSVFPELMKDIKQVELPIGCSEEQTHKFDELLKNTPRLEGFQFKSEETVFLPTSKKEIVTLLQECVHFTRKMSGKMLLFCLEMTLFLIIEADKITFLNEEKKFFSKLLNYSNGIDFVSAPKGTTRMVLEFGEIKKGFNFINIDSFRDLLSKRL